jgi:hypothetical protein
VPDEEATTRVTESLVVMRSVSVTVMVTVNDPVAVGVHSRFDTFALAQPAGRFWYAYV